MIFCLRPFGGLTCHSRSSFCSRLIAILLNDCKKNIKRKKSIEAIVYYRYVCIVRGSGGSGAGGGGEDLAGRGGGGGHG